MSGPTTLRAMRTLAFTGIVCLMGTTQPAYAKKIDLNALNPVPNVHMQLGCEACHSVTPKLGTPIADIKLNVPNFDINMLCETCHMGVEIHPVGIEASEEIKIPENLPVAAIGVHAGKIVCTTCHDIHAEMTSFSLLRGFPIGPGFGYRYGKKMDLCTACHGDNLANKQPHREEENLCSICHGGDPRENPEKTKIKTDITLLCGFCHEEEGVPHYKKFNIFADKKVNREIKEKLGMTSTNVDCLTCHVTHNNEGVAAGLKEGFVELAQRSSLINPHWTKVLCKSCHAEHPDDDSSAFISESITGACVRCHSPEGGVKAEKHKFSVEQVASKFILEPNEDFPYEDGMIGCNTCHQRDCEQEPGENPKFLRDGPYYPKNAICFKCHNEQAYLKTDPHKGQVDNGAINKESCIFCHNEVITEITGNGRSTLKADVAYLCMMCHPGKDHPGSDFKTGRGIKHTVTFVEKPPKLKKPDGISLSEGKLDCVSCHDPHQKGILKEDDLRHTLNCSNCHFM